MIKLSDITDEQLIEIVQEARKVEGSYLKIVIPKQKSHDDDDESVIVDVEQDIDDEEEDFDWEYEKQHAQSIVEIDTGDRDESIDIDEQENQTFGDMCRLDSPQIQRMSILSPVKQYKKWKTCLICEKIFPTRQQCGIHYFSEHVAMNAEERELAFKLSRFACGEVGCYATFGSPSDFLDHCLAHENIFPYICTEKDCDEYFPSRKILYQHKRKVHRTNKLFCGVCDAVYLTASSLNRHMVTHTGDKSLYQCELCLKEFGTTFNLKRHRKTHIAKTEEEKIRTHVCDICGGKYISKDTLRTHTQTVHADGEKPHTCDLCGKSFYRSFVLKRHMVTHTGEKPFECEQCHARFGTQSSLQRHMKKKNHSRELNLQIQSIVKM
ncbi:zinc finger and BTB domain-containing protein 41-like [Styela clava]